ncbi:DUF4232 domain-containing protein [Specibacter sp. NPDC078709]|uniref:DUF4232 domain-containing protein n=1 Tax=Specibacter sp. NPDC078709 TaxID=3154364 RepID=UPI003437C2C6
MTTAQRTIDAQRSPTHRPTWRTALVLAVALGLGGSLAACGPDNSGDLPSSASPSNTSSSSTSSASPSASSTASTTEATPSSAPSSAPVTPSGQTPVLCPAASLKGSLDDTGGGAAGHIYMTLSVTNTSAADCILDGYPGVSMVSAGSTEAIGAPADRDPAAPSNGPITLAPGQSAGATLRYTQAGNYQNCQRVQAESLLVYPPSAYDSLEIAHPLTACSNADIKLLTIGAFMP